MRADMPISTPLTGSFGYPASDPVGTDGRHRGRPPDQAPSVPPVVLASSAAAMAIEPGWSRRPRSLRTYRSRSASASSPGALPSSRHCWISRSKPARARSCFRSAIQALCAAHQVVRRAVDLPGPGRGDGAAGAGCRRRHPDRAGHRGRRPWRVAHHDRYRAGDRRSRSRPGAGRWPPAASAMAAGSPR